MTDEPTGLNQIAEKHYEQILAYCLKKTSGDRQMAEDCAVETFVRAQNARIAKAHPNAVGWLYKTARNVVHEKQREKKKYEKHNVSLERLVDEDIASLAPFLSRESDYLDELFAPDPGRDDEEIMRSKREILGTLPASDRELIALAYEKKLPLGEIARLTGRSKDAVRVKLARLTDKVTVMAWNCFDND